MNERIRELELEAIAYADSKVPADNRYNDIYYSIIRRLLAELIVRECAGINLKSSFQDGEFHAREVLEHFGVE